MSGDSGDSDDRDGQDQADNVVKVDFKAHANRIPPDPTAPQKLALFSRFIEQAKVMVSLDARRPGVAVPTRFASDAQLNLNFSLRFNIADFEYDQKGVRASLSFDRQPFFCDVPWGAVYRIQSETEIFTWPRSLPAEILEQLPEASLEQLEKLLDEQQERFLRATRVQREKEILEEKSGDDKPDEPPDDPPPKGGLRLVKS